MDIGSIFLILALLLLVALILARPLIDRKTVISEPGQAQPVHDTSVLLAERDRILDALQELDFDYSLGKIPTEDYPAQRAFLVQQGTQVLKGLDELGTSNQPGNEQDYLESVIAARRLESLSSGEEAIPIPEGVSPDDELEMILANRRRARSEKASGFCPQCGNATQKSDVFCPRCGHRLAG
jgi:hypothetical protein